MANDDRTPVSKRKRTKPLVYFYLNDKLHRVMYINRPHDLVETWCYPDKKRVDYVWSQIRRNSDGAWSTSAVGEILNRSHVQMRRYVIGRVIPLPQMTYTLDGQYRPFKYVWSEKDIVRLHEYILTLTFGRPRKDGAMGKPWPTPTRVELRAMLKRDAVDYYVKNKDGKMVRAWKEQNW